jgi:arylsulfatase A-like enzyme
VSEQQKRQRPDIIFFFTDDQRFDTIGALGNPTIHTPNFDSLVERGTIFTHAHIPGGTSAAVCMPSRAMLHTGRHLFHIEGAGEAIPSEHITMGEALQNAGYHCFGTGKWHNGPASYARSFNAGGQIFFGGMDDHWNVPVHDFDRSGRYDSTIPLCIDPWTSKEIRVRPGDHVSAGKHSSELFADAAIEFIENYTEEDPYFMYVSFMAPHDPRVMPDEYRDLYDPEQIQLPENFSGGHHFDNGALKVRDELLAQFPRDPGEIREHIADYYAMITHLDAQIGRVIEAVTQRGSLENTIIVLAGDNGLALGQQGLMGKQNLYEHSLRVPLVFSGPGVANGYQSNALVYLSDIFPTLFDLLKVEPPNSVEGLSLVPIMRQRADQVREKLYLAYTYYQRGVRDQRFKLIEYQVDGNRTTQLFDLLNDPWELKNLATEPILADELGRLRADLLNLREESDDLSTEWGKVFWAGLSDY